MKFSIRDFLTVIVTKSAGNCGFGHSYWRNPLWETSFFVQLDETEIFSTFDCFKKC